MTTVFLAFADCVAGAGAAAAAAAAASFFFFAAEDFLEAGVEAEGGAYSSSEEDSWTEMLSSSDSRSSRNSDKSGESVLDGRDGTGEKLSTADPRGGVLPEGLNAPPEVSFCCEATVESSWAGDDETPGRFSPEEEEEVTGVVRSRDDAVVERDGDAAEAEAPPGLTTPK